MSNPQSTPAGEPSDNHVLLSALGWLGVFCLFALIVIIAFAPNRSKSFYQQNAEARLSIRSEVDATQAQLLNNYAWENQAEGVVRIPIERAKELTLAELKAEQESSSD